MAINLDPLPSGLGARVTGVTLDGEIDGPDARALQDALHEHLLLLFPGTGTRVEDSDLLSFARRLGEINVYFRKAEGMPGERKGEVRIISNASEYGAVGGAEEIDWHTNISYQERCAAYTLLNSVELPDVAVRPKTFWANLRAAYADLPDDLKAELDGLRVHYSQKGYQGKVAFDPSEEIPQAVNSLVRTHPVTGRKSLYEIGERITLHVLDMDPDESRRILADLRQHATQEKYVYTHEWELGDTIVWDNLSTMHRREPWTSSQRRVMRVIDVLEATPSGSRPERMLGQVLPEDWDGVVARPVETSA